MASRGDETFNAQRPTFKASWLRVEGRERGRAVQLRRRVRSQVQLGTRKDGNARGTGKFRELADKNVYATGASHCVRRTITITNASVHPRVLETNPVRPVLLFHPIFRYLFAMRRSRRFCRYPRFREVRCEFRCPTSCCPRCRCAILHTMGQMYE